MGKTLLLIANYSPDRQWSMRLYLDLLQKIGVEGGWTILVLSPVEVFGRGRNTLTGFGKFLGYIDKYVLTPWVFRWILFRWNRSGSCPDLVHIVDHSNAMYAKCFRRIRTIVTCHDVIAIRRAMGEFKISPPKLTGRLQQRWILNSLRAVQNFTFVSQASRADLERLIKRDLTLDPVIFPTLAQSLQRVSEETARSRLAEIGFTAPKIFIFHHGNSSWYKNREQVLAVFFEVANSWPDVHLVCSGGDLTADQVEQAGARGLSTRIHSLGRVSHCVLEALYSIASVFFFPSWVEGFGWPPIEAQVCGCPVVASNAGSLAEVLGDSALLADPSDSATFSRAVSQVLGDPNKTKELRLKGTLNVARFSHDTMAREILKVYERS